MRTVIDEPLESLSFPSDDPTIDWMMRELDDYFDEDENLLPFCLRYWGTSRREGGGERWSWFIHNASLRLLEKLTVSTRGIHPGKAAPLVQTVQRYVWGNRSNIYEGLLPYLEDIGDGFAPDMTLMALSPVSLLRLVGEIRRHEFSLEVVSCFFCVFFMSGFDVIHR